MAKQRKALGSASRWDSNGQKEKKTDCAFHIEHGMIVRCVIVYI